MQFNYDDSIDKVFSILPTLRVLDEALRCNICKDLMIAPVITSCSHTFCSLCIRRCLTQKQQCPLCQRPEEEQRLRKNASMEEVIEAFQYARNDLVEFINRKKSTNESEFNTQYPIKDVNPTIIECPSCHSSVNLENIDTHLDFCLTMTTQNTTESSKTSICSSKTALYSHVKQPKLNYALLSESKLRSELKSLGLNITGNKVDLQRRHAEWINLWNANIDSKTPVDKQVLLKRLNKWDQEQSKSSIIKHTIDKDWTKIHKTEFKKLIQNARQSLKKRKIEIEPLINETSTNANQENT
ncbi:hypothetical protein PCANB_001143 [Pneumocystis canis]|nr:hypothetical protein PCK1_001219 [Pneumocystis canis]KAG5437167.1 hypothetical protein PCANB_001143 [Pneumocystis canis]